MAPQKRQRQEASMATAREATGAANKTGEEIDKERHNGSVV